MKGKLYARFLSLITGLLLAISLSFPAYAQQENSNKNKTIIFLLDASGSMKTNDPDRLAIDSVAQLTYTLPTDYKVGLVAFGEEILVQQEPVENEHRSNVMDVAEDIEYKGYSNAGEGLQKAVELLSADEAEERYIIMLSDGEILMDNDSETEESQLLYQRAIDRAAEEGITIHVMGLGEEMANLDNTIFVAAKTTAGRSFTVLQPRELQKTIDTILNEELHIKQSTIAMVDTDGGLETVSVELPYTYADKLRILITSNTLIHNLNAGFQAENANRIIGERYALIEINNPSDNRLELSFEGEEESQIRVNVIPEYYVVPKAEVVYTDTIPAIAEITAPIPYDRTAEIMYTFYREANQNVQLWDTEYFNYDKITVMAEGSSEELALKAGGLETKRVVTVGCEYEVQFDYSQLPVNVIGTESVQINLEAPPLMPVVEEPEPEPPYLFMGMIAAVIILILILAVLLIRYLNRPKPTPLPVEERPEPSKYSYVGKLNLYITQTQSGYDIPPLSYNLFRLPAGKVISLQEVLSDCGVEEIFPGADFIYLKAGANRNLILTNNSDCTIMKNREILMKKKSYQLSVESKVDISFEDEISELTFQYKDLKPSDMR